MPNHNEWLNKARNDLRSSRVLFKEKILDTCVYHAQQCAEKSLKSYLAYHKQPIYKTHDLELLINLNAKFDKQFKILINDAVELTPFCFKFRYPDDYAEPEISDAESSIKKAEKIYCFVKDKLHDLETGQKSII